MGYPPRLSLAHLPTPIIRLDRLSDELGLDFFVKRDDLTGALLTGNKVRKLEFLLAEAREQGADCLITCGAVQSNHARATAVAARQVGLEPYLMLRGQAPDLPAGNLMVDKLMGAKIRYVTDGEYSDRDALMALWAQDLKASGKRPYLIPEGGSNALGTLGYLVAAEEIDDQAHRLGGPFHSIVCPASTGATFAGLAMGADMTGCALRVVGFSVAEKAQIVWDRVRAVANEAIERFSLQVMLRDDEIDIRDSHVGLGYGQSRPEELQLIRTMASDYGLLLDPVYTVKAFLGLLDTLRGPHDLGTRILFVHTGGLFGLLGWEDLMAFDRAAP